MTEFELGRCAPEQPGECKHNRQQNCKNAQSGHGPVPQFEELILLRMKAFLCCWKIRHTCSRVGEHRKLCRASCHRGRGQPSGSLEVRGSGYDASPHANVSSRSQHYTRDEKVLVRAQKERPFTAGSLKFNWAFKIKRALPCGQQTTSICQTCSREWFYLDVLPF